MGSRAGGQRREYEGGEQPGYPPAAPVPCPARLSSASLKAGLQLWACGLSPPGEACVWCRPHSFLLP